MSDDQVGKARREAEAARQRLMEDVHRLQDRLRPGSLAEEAVENVRVTGWRAIGLARRNPIAASAGAFGLLLLIARRPLFGLIRRWRTDDEQN